MREIKFRAKNLYEDYLRVNKDDEELTKIEPGQIWVYGGYAEIDSCGFVFPERKTHFGHGDFWTDDDVLDIPIVDKNTLGQFTGLTDKNGKEIYEGDIVECVSWNEYFSDGSGKPMEPFRRKMYVDFRRGGFKMVEPMPEPMKDNEWDIIYNGDIKVVGNIYDNPELLNREGDTPMPVLPHKFNVGDTIRMKNSIAWSFTITDICKDSYIGKGFSLKFEVADMDWELVEEKKEE